MLNNLRINFSQGHRAACWQHCVSTRASVPTGYEHGVGKKCNTNYVQPNLVHTNYVQLIAVQTKYV